MRSSIYFFMHPLDASEFDTVASSINGLVISQETHYSKFSIDNAFILYQPCKIVGNILQAGSLSMATTNKEGQLIWPDNKPIEAAYKKLRGWVRKNYSNDLITYGKSKENAEPVNNFWLGNHAEEWTKTSGHVLKQFTTGNAVFEPSSNPSFKRDA